jgi:hypothetical protein
MGRYLRWQINHPLETLRNLICIAGQYLFLSEDEGVQLDNPMPIMNHYIAE